MRIALFLIGLAGLLVSCSISPPPAYDYLGQYIADTTAISAYVKSKNIQSTKLSYGVWFIDDAPGTGIRATYDE